MIGDCDACKFVQKASSISHNLIKINYFILNKCYKCLHKLVSWTRCFEKKNVKVEKHDFNLKSKKLLVFERRMEAWIPSIASFSIKAQSRASVLCISPGEWIVCNHKP